ncbi:unnamed protein product [Cochlearia groenlandica]
MANIPMDIIHDLFLRLPATTLVRFRLLSKHFLSLIDDPNFISSHLSRTIETGEHVTILLRGPRILRKAELDAPYKVSDVEHPLSGGGGFTEVFGSCNGLIGLANSPTDIAVFNPSTRRIRRLPYEPTDFPVNFADLDYVRYGLAYDSASDDYKVVRISPCKGEEIGGFLDSGGHYEIKIFSLKRNSWKRVKPLPFQAMVLRQVHYHLEYCHGKGVVAENSLHWVYSHRHKVFTVLSFDLASEEIGFVCIPMELLFQFIDLGVLDGCLCLMSIHKFSHVDVWIMRKYEHDGTWSKLFRVPKPESVESFESMKPLLYSKDRRQVLLEINDARNLVWFDLESNGFTSAVKIKGCDDPYSVELVVSSLVMGCKGDPIQVKRNKEQTKES